MVTKKNLLATGGIVANIVLVGAGAFVALCCCIIGITTAELGDCFTLGACVPSDKNVGALIRQHYPATLNLGISGAGPLIDLAVLKEYAQAKGAVVVLFRGE